MIVTSLGVYYPASVDRHGLPVIVMEKMLDSLRNLMEKYDDIPLYVKLCMLDEVSRGLRYLHNRDPPIVHRDLTSNNILLSYRLEAKISDLGVAKVVKAGNKMSMTALPGTPDFMPPEAQNRKPVYGPSLDVFSFGGVILNVITQQWPHPSDRTVYNNTSKKWELVPEVMRREGYLNKITGDAAELKSLVISCLDDSPEKRPSVEEVSVTIKSKKDAFSQKSSNDSKNPIVWWAEVSSNGQQSQVN